MGAMPPVSISRRLGATFVAAVAPVLLLLTAAPALATGEMVTLDVLKVVDGSYVVETVTVPAAQTDSAEASLEARRDVVYASPAVTYRVQGTPDPLWEADDPQAVSSVRDAWTTTRGAGQVVAVLDTAVDTSHPDLAGAFVPGTDTTGMAADAAEWHGTAVAGVVAARADNGMGSAGMAPEARIMPVRVCTNPGCPSAAVARGILWAADHGADVINMSLAGEGYSDVTAVAIRYALDKGISVVASAGNDGAGRNQPMYPAANSGVIAVSATDGGGRPSDWAVHGWQADIATVGERLIMPMPNAGYGYANGTSFSGPAVAGAVALVRAAHPGIMPKQTQAALQAGADASGWDRAWGAGRLDVPGAMAAADRTGDPVTATPSWSRLEVSWSAVPGASSYTVRVDGIVRFVGGGTATTISGLVDGNQVAVDVQADTGQRSRPVLTDVGPAAPGTPVLHSGSLTGSTLALKASVPGGTERSGRYELIRNDVTVASYNFELSAAPRSVFLNVGTAPTDETRWQLRAVDGYGRFGTPSNAVVVGSGRPPAPAAPPTGLTAALAPEGDRVLLTWDDVGTSATYRVSVGGNVVAAPQTAGAAPAAPPVGVSRTYAVAVVDAWGQAGPAASVAVIGLGSQRSAAPPGAPAEVTVTPGEGLAVLSWTAAPANGSPVTGYTVTAAPGGATTVTTGATTATVPGLTNATTYAFTVTATNAEGTGPASAPVSARPQDPAAVPGAPTGVTATLGAGKATVSWNAAAPNGGPVTGYTVTASPGGAAATTTGATTATVLGLTDGTSYAIRVTATNAAGTGPASSAVTPLPDDGGAIEAAYAATGGSGGPLGARAGSPYPTANGGVTQAYASGRIHWSPGTGAFAVYGDISKAYDPMQGESGALGYPVGGRYATANGGVTQAFQFGRIHTSPATGAHAVLAPISPVYDSVTGESGRLGYPVGPAYAIGGGRFEQQFERGRIIAGGGSSQIINS
ncbi:MAG: Peptidase and in kexin sedolisin [Blastococcus sp.]|nr:Peptidase and in kexin sedolisin [Blastococcus sp.]